MDIVKVRKFCLITERKVAEVAVGGCIDFEHEGWEVYVEPPKARVADKSKTPLAMMSAEAIQGIAKGRYVKYIPNENFVDVKQDDHCFAPLHQGKRLVAHADLEIGNVLI